MLKCDCVNERERYFLAIANAAGDIIHFNNTERPIHDASPATEFLLGYSSGKLSGLPVMDLVHPADREIVLDAMASTVAGSAPPAREIRMLKKDGTLIDTRMSTFSFKVDGRDRAGAVLRDVSGERATQEKLDEYHALLHHLETNDPALSIRIPETIPDIIPVCAYCSKIRNQDGIWMHPTTYLRTHTGAELSHGVCPGCAGVYYPGFKQKNDPTPGDG